MGPSGSGKTTLIRCLVKYYARYNLGDPGEAGHGPITGTVLTAPSSHLNGYWCLLFGSTACHTKCNN